MKSIIFKQTRKAQKGQTLLFVVVAVTIALTIGVAVSTRTISSLKRVARTDTSARVIASAEGGIENLLGKNYEQLDSSIGEASAVTCGAIDATFETQGSSSACVYTFSDNPQGKDLISSKAYVKVEKFNSNESDGGYSFDLEPGTVREVHLLDYENTDDPKKVKICWNEETSVIYYYSYNDIGEVLKGGLCESDYCDDLKSGFISGTFQEGEPFDEGYLCKTVDLVDSPWGLRIKTLYNRSKIVVYPVGTDVELPDQGYRLTSKGEITMKSGNQEVATIIVHKTYPFAPSVFDYGIYTPNPLITQE